MVCSGAPPASVIRSLIALLRPKIIPASTARSASIGLIVRPEFTDADQPLNFEGVCRSRDLDDDGESAAIEFGLRICDALAVTSRNLAPAGDRSSSVEYRNTSGIFRQQFATIRQRIRTRAWAASSIHCLQHEAVMRLVVAAKGANADQQGDVDVGSRLVRSSIRTAHQTEHWQVHWFLLREEPWEQPLPQAVAGDFRFVGNGRPIGYRFTTERRPEYINPMLYEGLGP